MTMQKISDKQKLVLIGQLEERNLFFKRFWSISDVYFTDKIPTAAVTSHDDKVQFLFNPEFWETLSESGRLFVICHEQLHLMNNHFTRLQFSKGNASLKNVAADIAINESLVRAYGFKKTDLPNHENYIWHDTVFNEDEQKLISDNETAEFYYSILHARQQEAQKELNEKLQQMAADGTLTDAIKEALEKEAAGNTTGDIQSFDDHIFSEENQDVLSKEVRESIEDALDELVESGAADKSKELDKAAKRLTYKKAKEAGTASSVTENRFDFPIKKQRHWKKLYKNICKSIYEQTITNHWAFTDRKMALLQTGLDLPSNQPQDALTKVRVLVYLDVSGSCVNDTKFFLRNAMSLPSDLFEVSYFTFDTAINSIPIAPPYDIRSGGGTCFKCIREHVENEIKHYDAVFIFTDGEASQVNVDKPKKWFWFISPAGTHSDISEGSRSFDLSDFGWDEMKAKEANAGVDWSTDQ